VIAASTATTDGVDLAAAYIVNHATAPVVSLSYANCEQEMGAAELAFYNDLWEQAASQGMSVFVASGDAGAAECSDATSIAGTRLAINGLCSSPYATCVGGTEFHEGPDPAQYWSATNSAGYESAIGYIPEVVWNESAANGGSGLWASGGGASKVYAQPTWQAEVSGAGASNGMRAVPDVALASADHDGSFAVINGTPSIVSGTSIATPEFAGLMALVIEKQRGAVQGNANPRLYALSSANPNPFHTTLSGNNSVPGVAGFAANGETYNLATGLGSVDAALLVDGWKAGPLALPVPERPIRCSRSGLEPGGCRPTAPAPRRANPGR
jgi:pseudomonalisin